MTKHNTDSSQYQNENNSQLLLRHIQPGHFKIRDQSRSNDIHMHISQIGSSKHALPRPSAAPASAPPPRASSDASPPHLLVTQVKLIVTQKSSTPSGNKAYNDIAICNPGGVDERAIHGGDSAGTASKCPIKRSTCLYTNVSLLLPCPRPPL